MRIVVVLTVLVMVIAGFNAAFQAVGEEHSIIDPVEEAATWSPLIPMKNLFLVKYDPESYEDDYAYMAAVPSAVFYDKEDAVVYASPLLYWEPARGLSGENLPQDSVVGVDYFMEDWLNYSGLQLHNAQYLNMDTGEVEEVNDAWQLNSSTSKVYDRTDPYTVAKDIALYNWRYSDTVVVAVISTGFEEDMDDVSEGSVNGQIPSKEPNKAERAHVHDRAGLQVRDLPDGLVRPDRLGHPQ